MRKLSIALATASMFGVMASALALDSATAAQTRTPVAQANIKSKTNMNSMKLVHRSHGVNKMVQHDRGLHRGFTHSRHYGYPKKSVRR
jgi:hypothetical protein